MALALRKFARLPIPAGPMNFSRCGGKALYPLLFVAVYLCYSIYANSYYFIMCGVGSFSGEYWSGITSSLKKISLLKAVNALTGTGLSLVLRYFNIYQNCFGLCLSIFGRSCDRCDLLVLHVRLKLW
jgi:hypothetical protein